MNSFREMAVPVPTSRREVTPVSTSCYTQCITTRASPPFQGEYRFERVDYFLKEKEHPGASRVSLPERLVPHTLTEILDLFLMMQERYEEGHRLEVRIVDEANELAELVPFFKFEGNEFTGF